MGLKVTVKVNARAIADSLITPDLKRYANTRLYAYCDEFVPYKTGHLSQDVRISDEGVHYITPYAVYPYTGTHMHFRTDHHPLATAYWDKAAMTSKGDLLTRDIENAVRSRGR